MAEQNSVLTQIARPYAAALFDLAKSEGSVDAVESGLGELTQLSGMAKIIPPIFLLVSAFLIDMIFSRMRKRRWDSSSWRNRPMSAGYLPSSGAWPHQ